MVDTYYAYVDERDYSDALQMLREWRATKSSVTPGVNPVRDLPVEDELVVLLDTLEAGETVKAAVLTPRTGLNETQYVTALGTPDGGYMRIGFKPSETAETEWTPLIYPLIDDASKIQQYMEELPSLSPNDIRVGLGLKIVGTAPNLEVKNPWRWLFTFQGRYAGVNVQPLIVEAAFNLGYCVVQSITTWVDSYRVVDVSEVIGVPVPTPLKHGSRAWVRWKRNFGYCVIAAEARDFGDYDLFI